MGRDFGSISHFAPDSPYVNRTLAQPYHFASPSLCYEALQLRMVDAEGNAVHE